MLKSIASLGHSTPRELLRNYSDARRETKSLAAAAQGAASLGVVEQRRLLGHTPRGLWGSAATPVGEQAEEAEEESAGLLGGWLSGAKQKGPNMEPPVVVRKRGQGVLNTLGREEIGESKYFILRGTSLRYAETEREMSGGDGEMLELVGMEAAAPGAANQEALCKSMVSCRGISCPFCVVNPLT